MKLTKSLYFGDFFAAPFVIIVLAAATLARRDLGATPVFLWLLALAAGCAAWTLVEYVVHRWIYHEVPPFEKFHDAHHAQPRELVGAPSFLSIGVILAVVFVPLLAFGLLLASGFTSGMLVGYIGYILVHHATHHWEPRPGSLLYDARIRHMLHHYHDTPGNYGVTSSFWDRVFATHVEPRARPRLRPARKFR